MAQTSYLASRLLFIRLVFGELRLEEPLVVQHYVEQRAVDLQTAVVVNETQFPKPVHEKADSRTSRAYHLGQGLLTDFGNSILPLRQRVSEVSHSAPPSSLFLVSRDVAQFPDQPKVHSSQDGGSSRMGDEGCPNESPSVEDATGYSREEGS